GSCGAAEAGAFRGLVDMESRGKEGRLRFGQLGAHATDDSGSGTGRLAAARDRAARSAAKPATRQRTSGATCGRGSPKGVFCIIHGSTNGADAINTIRPRAAKPEITIAWQPAQNQFIASDGSAYDILGRVLKGPATQPLPGTLATRNPDGSLSVNLDKLTVSPATP
ncbi:MAG: hypothetical protein WCQ44_10755, partial [Opitutaceae bacterium]